jgi:hypothetical protein
MRLGHHALLAGDGCKSTTQNFDCADAFFGMAENAVQRPSK